VFALNMQSKHNIKEVTGLTFEELIGMDFDDIDKAIEQKIGKKLKFMRSGDPRLIMRGQVYHYLGRMADMGDIDKRLGEIADSAETDK